jgi:hypothetical protein
LDEVIDPEEGNQKRKKTRLQLNDLFFVNLVHDKHGSFDKKQKLPGNNSRNNQ